MKIITGAITVAIQGSGNLSRFQGLCEEVTTAGLSRAVDTDAVQRSVLACMAPVMEQRRASVQPLHRQDFDDLNKTMRLVLIQEAILPLLGPGGALVSCLPQDMPLRETRHAAHLRERANSRLHALRQAERVFHQHHG